MKDKLRCNIILTLRHGDTLIEDVIDIKEHVFDHFNSRFQDSKHRRPRLDGKKVIWNSLRDKIPGLNGFTMGSYKASWDFILIINLTVLMNFSFQVIFQRKSLLLFLL